MAKRKQDAPLPQLEPAGAEEPETEEPESNESLAEEHARNVAEETELETPPGVELTDDTVTCKRCGNTYAMVTPPKDFNCTDRRCPLQVSHLV